MVGAPPRLDAFSRVPLQFEVNQGQTDARVTFLARGRGHMLFLTAAEAVLTLGKPRRAIAIRMSWEGGKPVAPVGLEALPGRVNYFLGNDPAKWRTNVPTFAKVRYRSVYPGVDVIYYSKGGRLEYDLVIAPRADASTITLAIEGADAIEIDAEGHLVMTVAGEQKNLHSLGPLTVPLWVCKFI